MRMITAASSERVNENLKQPKCPSVREYMNKLWYVYMMKYMQYAIIMNKLDLHA